MSSKHSPVEKLPGISGYANLLLSRMQQTFVAAWEGKTSNSTLRLMLAGKVKQTMRYNGSTMSFHQSRDRAFCASFMYTSQKVFARGISLKH